MKSFHLRWDDSSGRVQLIAEDGTVLWTGTKEEWSWVLANPVKGKIK